MPGVKALRKLQFGRESTAGTAVAATTVWRGMGTILDAREVTFVEEDIGYLPGWDRSYIGRYMATLELEETPATFEQLPHILEMGLHTDTPAQDGTGSGYIYQYDPATTAQKTIKSYTIEGGDDQQAEEMEYCHCTEFNLSGSVGEAWMLTATIAGRQVANTTYTGALTPPSVEDMLFSKTKLYIDDTGGTIGSTQATSTLISAELAVTTGTVAYETADGNLYYTAVKQIMPEWVLTLTMEHNSTATTEKTNWRAETAQLIRLQCLGDAVADNTGATYNNKTMNIDLAGKWESFDKIDENDGNDVITATFRARYVTADSLFAQILIVNELSSLP